MKSTIILGALALSALAHNSTPLSAIKAADKQAGPPGMVRIAGDRYDIGADSKQIAEMIEETQLTALQSETPQHSVKMSDFYIMPTELTNEQFSVYVKATNSKPPQSWAKKAIDDATYAYAERTGKARDDAKKAGLEVPKIEPFSATDWWKRNWVESDWEVPKDKATHPVVYIDHDQAMAYSRWAGVRLISEQEFQVAGRGKIDREFSTSGKPTPKTNNSIEANLGQTAKVGSFKEGSSWVDSKGRVVEERTERNSKDVQPIFDLCGSVWEWTRSPFSAYPGFKQLEVKLKSNRTKKKEKLPIPPFDPNNRSAMGGAFSTPPIATRLTTRRNSARWQATDNLGMRCTASTIPGEDVAETIMRMDLPVSRRPDDTLYTPAKITAIDKWKSSPGTAAVPNYAIIEGYEYMAFIPVEKTGVNSALLLKDRSRNAPIQIGAFTTTLPVIEPALEPGTYTLSWRAAGEFRDLTQAGEQDEAKDDKKKGKDNDKAKKKDKKKKGKQAEPEEEVIPEFPFDPEIDTMLIHNTDGELVTWMRVNLPDETRAAPGRISLKEISPEVAETKGTKAGTQVTFRVFTPAKKASKGFIFTIPIILAPGMIDDTWRR